MMNPVWKNIALGALISLAAVQLSGCAFTRLKPETPIYYTEAGVPQGYEELRRVRGRGFGYCLNREGVYNTATKRALAKAETMAGDAIIIPDSFTVGGTPQRVRCRWILQLFLLPGGMGQINAVAIRTGAIDAETQVTP